MRLNIEFMVYGQIFAKKQSIYMYICAIEAICDFQDTPYAANRRQIHPTMAISPLTLASRSISSLSIG